jgi:hypothetical protein
LKWRIYTIVIEEAWYLAAELDDFLNSTPDKKEWKSFLLKLTLCTKNKDSEGLWGLVHEEPQVLAEIENGPSHQEIKTMMDFHSAASGDFNSTVINFIAEDIYNHCYGKAEAKEQNEYERKALRLLYRRAKMGGMIGDRCICLSSMILVSERKLDEKTIKDEFHKKGPERWKKNNKRTKFKPVSIPWYAFDFHTQAGKIALNIFMKHHAKKYNIPSVDKFKEIWFCAESVLMKRDLINIIPPVDNPTVFDTIWFQFHKDHHLSYNSKSADEVKKLWASKLRQDIRGCVEWILDKRSDK